MDTIFTITQLNTMAKEVLEHSFPAIWVEGEISNFKLHPPSGHMYFSLKDESAQVRCAMFRMQNRSLDFMPADGCHVLVRAKVTLYENRGDYQLVADYMEQSGVGQLLRQFEILKEKLAKEGLFSAEHKHPLPTFPTRIGIITSPSGAAVKDIIKTLQRRFPSAALLIYPTLVQGNEASLQLYNAINLANSRKDCDVLILARGGGSLEDLWAFNDEMLARAIYASQIPIVTGIGHETDFTIADFVADQRASTPTAAAELCTPDATALLSQIMGLKNRLRQLMAQYLQNKSQTLDFLQKRLIDPRTHLRQQRERLDYFHQRLIQAEKKYLTRLINHCHQSYLTLMQHNPLTKLKRSEDQLRYLLQQLIQRKNNLLQAKHQELSMLCHKLDTLSPLATLARGYAIVSNMQGQLITDCKEVTRQQSIKARLAHGEIVCEVIEICGEDSK